MSGGRKFMRVLPEGSDEPEKLQTAVIRYTPKDGAGDSYVDFIGAIHIGDRSYYQTLNALFAQYETVLFELVASEDTLKALGDKDGTPSRSILHLIQGMVCRVLQLEHQVDLIDYSVPNMLHADLSPEGLKKAMQARGASLISILLEVLGEMLRQSSNGQAPAVASGPSSLLQAISGGGEGARQIKSWMAKLFREKVDDIGMSSKTLHGLIIVDRNEAALRVLRKELDSGKKKIAIFYGAGHGPDFEERLERDFGLVPTGQGWLTAWDLGATKALTTG